MCVSLARLTEDFTTRADGYDKVDAAVPAARLAPLAATRCPRDRDAMLRAAHTLVAFHRQLGLALARAHGMPYERGRAPRRAGRGCEQVRAPATPCGRYPERLTDMMYGRLLALSPSTGGPREEPMRSASS